jgi:hypothetical protein
MRVVKREVGFLRLKKPGCREPKQKQTLFGAKMSIAEGKWMHGEERAMVEGG